MTANELRNLFNNTFGLDKRPKTYEVDAETYGNICQHIINHLVNEINLFFDWDKLELGEYSDIRTICIVVGPNDGLMFKGIELILKKD